MSLANWARLFDFGSGATANMFLTPRGSGGTARFAITSSGSGGEQRINAPAALPTGTWTHVAVDGFRLYSRVLTAAEVADLHATGQ